MPNGTYERIKKLRYPPFKPIKVDLQCFSNVLALRSRKCPKTVNVMKRQTSRKHDQLSNILWMELLAAYFIFFNLQPLHWLIFPEKCWALWNAWECINHSWLCMHCFLYVWHSFSKVLATSKKGWSRRMYVSQPNLQHFILSVGKQVSPVSQYAGHTQRCPGCAARCPIAKLFSCPHLLLLHLKITSVTITITITTIIMMILIRMATEGMAIMSESMEPPHGPQLGHRLPQVRLKI